MGIKKLLSINIKVLLQLEKTYLMVELLLDYLEVLLFDLALFSQVVIVLSKLLECVILAVMSIDLLHNLWISSTYVH